MTSGDQNTDQNREQKDVLEGEIILPERVLEHVKGDFEGQQSRVRKRFWPTARKALRHIPFMEDVVAAYFCAMDSSTPFRVRAALIGALAYFVLPIDAIPDVLTLVGFADDASVLLAVLTLVGSHIKDTHTSPAVIADRDAVYEWFIKYATGNENPGTSLLSRDDARRKARFEALSSGLKFPDIIDLEVVSLEDGKVSAAILSQSLLGMKDFGVNSDRLNAWLKAFQAEFSQQ
jgi:uncharacterized membrane protein YkvA (DUF1232 family)